MKKFIVLMAIPLFFLKVQGQPVSVKNEIIAKTASAGQKEATVPALAFPALRYSHDALEPYIDKMTMEIHYSKHFQTYYNNYIKAIQGTDLEKVKPEDLFRNISKYPEALRNNAGGFYNHSLYFDNMAPGGGKPEGKLLEAIVRKFGTYEEFVKQFTEAGKSRFGSGWAWLSLDKSGNLFISSTPNQDNPLMDVADKQGIPLLAMDVWEHAYYLKYQNRRTDYIDAFWKVVNWKEVGSRYMKTMSMLEK